MMPSISSVTFVLLITTTLIMSSIPTVENKNESDFQESEKQLMGMFGGLENTVLSKLDLTQEAATEMLMEALRYQATNISSECGKALKFFVQDLLNQTAYTYQALDAWGKPPPGILQGNRLWMGRYSECLNTIALAPNNVERFRGQYCTTVFENPDNPKLYIALGICVPYQCTSDDIQRLGESLGETYMLGDGRGLKLDTTYCATEKEWLARDIIALLILSLLGLLAVTGTSLDIYQQYRKYKESRASRSFANSSSNPDHISASAALVPSQSIQASVNATMADEVSINQSGTTPSCQEQLTDSRLSKALDTGKRVLLCFSWLTNGQKLLETKVRLENLSMLNGVRVLSIWWIMLGHTCHFIADYFANPLASRAYLQQVSLQVVGNAYVSVDSFFFLSGLLVAYLSLKELNKNDGKLNWALFYFHRFWRLTPVYMVMLMFWCTVNLHLPRGPDMRTLDTLEAVTSCYSLWWTNMLYINNFYPDTLREQCMGWTWYLANDMQFYIISPILLILFFKYRRVGLGVVVGLIVVCLAATGGVARYYGVQPMTSSRQFGDFKHWQYIYVRPYHRIAPYLVGLIIGYILYLHKGKVTIPKKWVLPGWGLAVACNIAVLFGLYSYYEQMETMQADVAAFYLSTHRFAWSLGLAWLTVACISGYGGPINMFLSWRMWAPLGRMTYVVYLVHPMVMKFTYASLRQPVIGNTLNIIYYFFGHLVLSYCVAFVISLLVEAPLMALEKVLFRRK